LLYWIIFFNINTLYKLQVGNLCFASSQRGGQAPVSRCTYFPVHQQGGFGKYTHNYKINNSINTIRQNFERAWKVKKKSTNRKIFFSC